MSCEPTRSAPIWEFSLPSCSAGETCTAMRPSDLAATSSANLLAPRPLGLDGGELWPRLNLIGAWAWA